MMQKTTIKSLITGHYDGTVLDLVEPFRKYSPQTFDRALRLAPIYLKYDRKFNIRADVAWGQMIHETGYLNFKGTAKPEWNNFAGIGVTGPTAIQTFKTEDLGVLAHFVHLCWYVFPDHVNTLCSRAFDPRHFETAGKHHPKYNGDASIGRLSQNWAFPGIEYADKIVNYVNIINKTNSGELEDVVEPTIKDSDTTIKDSSDNKGYDVIIQEGHVGRKKGATGAFREQEFNKKLGDAMRPLLVASGLKFKIMGADDWDIPKPNKTTIFFALHYDGATDKNARGYSLGFKPDTDESFKEAMAVSYGKLSGFKRRKDNYTNGLKMYYGWKNVSAKYYALLEHGFGSNDIEREWMFNNINSIAKHHVDLIIKFLKG